MTATLTWVCMPPDCVGAAMQTGIATRYRPHYRYRHGYDIDTLFWGALIFLAVFVCCFLAWKAIERLRNRKKASAPTGVTASATAEAVAGAAADAGTALPPQGRGHVKKSDATPLESVDQKTAWTSADPYYSAYSADPYYSADRYYGVHRTDTGGMNQRDEEEFLLAYGPRKVRKAIKERRKARELAQKKQSQS